MCVWFYFQNSALKMSKMKHSGSFPLPSRWNLWDHEWNRTQQIGVLSSHPFESDTEMSDIDDDDRETIFSSMDLLSPSGSFRCSRHWPWCSGTTGCDQQGNQVIQWFLMVSSDCEDLILKLWSSVKSEALASRYSDLTLHLPNYNVKFHSFPG